MREIVESGFTVRVPRASSFRFAEIEAYRKLSGKHLKEMDIGWWDDGKLYLLELKGAEIWDKFDVDRDSAHKHITSELSKKVTDVLLILGSVWSETEIGKNIASDLPPKVRKYPGESGIKLIFLVDTPDSRKPLMAAVKDNINRHLEGRINLFGIKRVTIVDLELAQKMGLPIERP